MCLKENNKERFIYIGVICVLLCLTLWLWFGRKSKVTLTENRNVITDRHTIERPDGTKETFETIKDTSVIKDETIYGKGKNAFVGIIYVPTRGDYYIGGGILFFQTISIGCYTNHNIDFLIMANFHF